MLRECAATSTRFADHFLNDARFEIAGASRGSPTVVTSVGLDKFRPLFALK
jgi:hypothetical protein